MCLYTCPSLLSNEDEEEIAVLMLQVSVFEPFHPGLHARSSSGAKNTLTLFQFHLALKWQSLAGRVTNTLACAGVEASGGKC